MDAMILAAGLGTRLGDVTRHIPKALVDVAGQTALERVARRLIAAGADRLVINVHHHADSIIRHVEEHGGFGVDVAFSREDEKPLETGGGLLAAAPLLRRDAPFFLHNVDVLSDADLEAMYAAHVGSDALATLAVSKRPSPRRLLFDELGLCGRTDARTGTRTVVRDGGVAERELPFAGIHVVSPALLDRITESGAFSIMETYLRLAAEGETLLPFDITASSWLEIGNPERLDAARRALSQS